MVEENERDSGMELSVSLVIGYKRKRPSTDDRFETRIDSFGLLLVGSIVVLTILVIVLPRILSAIGLS